jgi:hypothetical protein
MQKEVQNVLDEILEVNGGIGKTKVHDIILKETIASTESSFALLTFSHLDYVIYPRMSNIIKILDF